MKEALLCVMESKLTVRLAAERYDVSRSTLQDRERALNSGQEVIFELKLRRFDSTFVISIVQR